MMRTFKFRLYPSNSRKEVMEQILETCRNLYNNALAERKDAWEKEHRPITYSEQQNRLPLQKAEDQKLSELHSQVLQDVLRRVDRAFKSFFRRAKANERPGYPRFKNRERYDSFTYPQHENGFSLIDGRLRLSKIGDAGVRLHRRIPEGTVLKTCTIHRDVDRWYACISAEIPACSRPRNRTERAIGIDAGLTSLLTLSTGETIANPRHLQNSEERLAKEQQRLSKKQRGSSNRFRQRLKVARTHRKIREQRRDFAHKLSRMLVEDYDEIVFEDLKVREMMQQGFLAKFIGDAGWIQLMNFTQYKAEEAGAAVEFVDARNTTKRCSGCGRLVPKKLSERVHRCSFCGLEMERDLNAALNILARATVGTTGSYASEDGQKGSSMKEDATGFSPW